MKTLLTQLYHLFCKAKKHQHISISAYQIIIIGCTVTQAFTQGQAPPQGSILGLVQDSKNNQAIEFATISVHRLADSSLVTGGITDEKGAYEIKQIPVGQYYAQIDFVGYQSQIQNFSMTAQLMVVNLPPTLLEIAAATLETAEVTAESSDMQLGIDRKIFDVEKSQLNKGGNAIDVLRNTPTLDVDMNGNVSFRGSQGVNILINGKPSGLDGASREAILKQIPANMIKSIEIISSPSAKYDPDGISGIINIVLKKNKMQGFSGNVSYSIGTLGNKHDVTVGLNFRNEKINLFANYNFNYRGSWETAEARRKTFYPDSSYNYFSDNTLNNRLNYGHFAKIGLDYFINDKNTLSLSASVNPGTSHLIDSFRFAFFDEDMAVTNQILRSADQKELPLNMNYNLNYSTSFKTAEQKLEFDANYAYYNAFQNSYYRTDDLLNPSNNAILQYNTDAQTNHVLNIKLDYTHPFKNEGKLELGAKGGYRVIGNDFHFKNYNYSSENYETDLGTTNNFLYTEQIYALYGTYGQKIKKFSFQAGLRLEQALIKSSLITTNESFSNNYFSFFPSVHLNYELPKDQQLQLAYSRRINRPQIHTLNPFADRTDPYTLHIGNPALKPEYINSIELTYAKYWKKGSFTSSLYYRHTSDVIRRLYDVDAQGVGSVRYTNFDEEHAYGIELATSLQLFKWWRLNSSINAYMMQEDGTNLDAQYRNSTFTGHASLGSNFELPLDFGAQFNLVYRAPMYLVIGSITGNFHSSFAVSKSFLKKSLKITLSIQDPFWVETFGYDLASDNYINHGVHRWESRVAYLSISYDFGKMDMMTKSRMNQRGFDAAGGAG